MLYRQDLARNNAKATSPHRGALQQAISCHRRDAVEVREVILRWVRALCQTYQRMRWPCREAATWLWQH